jgi:hypothetical protein
MHGTAIRSEGHLPSTSVYAEQSPGKRSVGTIGVLGQIGVPNPDDISLSFIAAFKLAHEVLVKRLIRK